jgi:uncharacterized SAM-binding protein YcdF (DUF218 family)
MDFTKKVLEICTSPIGIMVALLIIGAGLSILHKHRRVGHRFMMAGACLYLIFLFSPMAEIAIRSLEKTFPPLLSPPSGSKIERIIILAGYGEVHPEYPVTSNLYQQTISSLVEGVRLYRLLPGSKFTVSGGVVRTGDKPIGALMAEFLNQIGVPSEDILVEGKATNTYENLANTKGLVGTNPFILVAAACDLRRAMGVAHRLGMQPVPAPAGIWVMQNWPANMSAENWVVKVAGSFATPSHERLIRLQWAYHEYLGYIWYWILHRV